MKARLVEIQTAKRTDRIRPKIIRWKGIDMVRNHSFLATIEEIVRFSNKVDVCRIGLIGDMDSGKSTLAQAIACAAHHKSKIPYTVRIFYEADLLNFKETLASLEPANYILVFDDVSFMGANANKKQVEMVKQAVTKIRHLPGGQDVKIIIIMNYHYTLGLDKYLRSADFRYFTSVGSSEKENMEKILGSKYMPLIKQLKHMRHQGITNDRFTLRIGPKEHFSYKYREPFIPLIFFNEQSPRIIVSPTRQFMYPVCSICANAGKKTNSDVDMAKFKEETDKLFRPETIKAVVKQILHDHGLGMYSKEFTRIRRYFDRALAQQAFSFEEMAVTWGLTKETVTKLKHKPMVPIKQEPSRQPL